MGFGILTGLALNDMDQYTGTQPVADNHAFDVNRLLAYLDRFVPGFAGPLSVEQFKGGQSNPTYKLVTPAAAYVMRSKPAPAARLLPWPMPSSASTG